MDIFLLLHVHFTMCQIFLHFEIVAMDGTTHPDIKTAPQKVDNFWGAVQILRGNPPAAVFTDSSCWRKNH